MTTLSAPAPTRRRLVVRGVVQGVGFRPFVARLADELGLAGSCHNDATCVVVEVEGRRADVDSLTRRLQTELPPLAHIDSVESVELAVRHESGFTIRASTSGAGERTMVPPDTAVCADCLRELGDPADRRYRHPFITCTHCGPRYTITLDLPYDRPATTMAPFPLCAACAGEYADPRDRRYHAQPIGCHDCGPALRLADRNGSTLAGGTRESSEAVVRAAVTALRSGAILAVKGIGGFHLVCDAGHCSAVGLLRHRKHRPHQPFAVMVPDLTVAERYVEVGGAAELLTGPVRPIVLLPARQDSVLVDWVAPGLGELGVMLPYAPLHHLLFADGPDGEPGAPEVLVMTSGNLSGEPLCFTDEDAFARLGDIADLFVAHDREIAVPCEDSVVAWSEATGAVPVRRSRGLVPLPIDLRDPADGPGPQRSEGVVLATGAELKNSVALARDGRVFVSAHLGDLESLASRSAHAHAVDRLLGFHRSTPALVVADRHPGYAARAAAVRLAEQRGVPLHEVQHHHAHLASLAAEHGRLELPLLGLVYDGTGYGCDATVWGGELLLLRDGGLQCDRLGHLGDVRLPGGDAGVRNPVRTAALALLDAGATLPGTEVDAELSDAERSLLRQAHTSGLGLVDTSSVGRLFDVASSLLGIRHRVSYEAQAAIELEAAARSWRHEHPDEAAPTLPFDVVDHDGSLVLDPHPLVAELARARAAGTGRGALAWAFHAALADTSATAATDAARRAGVRTVGLSGGVFVNRLLLDLTGRRLADNGLEVLVHRRVPANDGGLSLGQAAVGARRLRTRPADQT